MIFYHSEKEKKITQNIHKKPVINLKKGIIIIMKIKQGTLIKPNNFLIKIHKKTPINSVRH